MSEPIILGRGIAKSRPEVIGAEEIAEEFVFPGGDRNRALDHPILHARLSASKPADLVILKAAADKDDPLPNEAATRADDTLPKRWFEEAIGVGPYKGEKIDRGEFDKMLSRFYAISNLTEEGVPTPEWREELEGVLTA